MKVNEVNSETIGRLFTGPPCVKKKIESTQYYGLSNKGAGCNKHAGLHNSQNQ